ncbi:MAG TPA: hypothetical protein PKJ07_03360 [Bacteroidales bacterium]|nr:hypothetical protein [Bacteroidales bacterium]HPU47201.1 hypothetical protein [Bacteroidales bacterium]HQD34849.1 hypothetical protein [Bacteroidales bacterium]
MIASTIKNIIHNINGNPKLNPAVSNRSEANVGKTTVIRQCYF